MKRYKVQNRFAELLAEKARREERSISKLQVVREFEELGFESKRSSIQSWATNSVTRFDEQQIAEFCAYLDCTIEDLLVLVPIEDEAQEEENEGQTKTPQAGELEAA